MSWLYMPEFAGGGLPPSSPVTELSVTSNGINTVPKSSRPASATDTLAMAPSGTIATPSTGVPGLDAVDCISAGFPCQPFSVAGKGLAEHDPRNGWPSTKRIIGEVRPWLLKLENVPGLLSKSYIRRIFGDLAELGYDAEWGCLSAKAVGAPHVRNRLWILAYAAGVPEQLRQLTRQEGFEPARFGFGGNAADSNSERCKELKFSGSQKKRRGGTLPSKLMKMGDVSGGFLNPLFVEEMMMWPIGWTDFKSTGNGQVSAVAYNAFRILERRIAP